jgi:hypothetical protein
MKNKIFAVAITIIIWLQVNLLTEQCVTRDIPIRIDEVADNLYLYKNNDFRVPIKISGRGLDIIKFIFKGSSINYPGDSVTPGKYNLDYETLKNSLPEFGELKFTVIDKEQPLEVTTDRIMQKKVPVVYDFNSDKDKETLLNNNYLFEEYFVTISGPSQEVQNIEQVSSNKIKSDIMRARNKNITLKSVNEHIVIVPPTIELTKSTDITTTKTIQFIPIEHDQTKLDIFPQRVTVKIEGKLDTLNKITAEEITAYIQHDGRTNEADILFRKPDYIKIIDYTPEKVNVTVRG